MSDEQQLRDDWHRPVATRVRTGLTGPGGRVEEVEGDPVPLQDWDVRLWEWR